jgi:WD40 repeat protein
MAHDGEIHYVNVDAKNNWIITAGDDGAVRFWSYESIDVAEATDEQPRLELVPLREVNMPEGVKIRGVLRGVGHWVLLGNGGNLWQVDDTLADGRRAKSLLRFHSGRINAVSTSPVDHFATTAGDDGTVRCWDYVDRMCLFSSRFPTAATCIEWAPKTLDADCRTIAVGFASGVVRILYRTQHSFKVLSVMKPHDGRVDSVGYCSDGKTMATCGVDRRVFFLSTSGSGASQGAGETFTYDPIGFCSFSEERGHGVGLTWRDDGRCVLMTLPKIGEALEIGIPGTMEGTSINTDESFDVTSTCTMRSHTFTPKPTMNAPMVVAATEEGGGGGDNGGDNGGGGEGMENPFEAAKIERCSIVTATYLPNKNDTILCTVASSTMNHSEDAPATQVHVCTFGKEYADDELSGHTKIAGGAGGTTTMLRGTTSVLGFSSSKRVLLSGGGDGSTMVRCVTDGVGGAPIGTGTNSDLSSLSPFFVNVMMHDAENPELTVTGAACSHDDKYLLTTGSRGGFFSFRIRYDDLEKSAQEAADGRAKELAARAAKAALVSTATVTAEMDSTMDEIFGPVSSSVPGDFHDDDMEKRMSEVSF